VPDFVVETTETIFLIEIKAANVLEDPVVKMKESAAINYCIMASEINEKRKEKAWKYVLIPDRKAAANMTFKNLVTEFGK
jgi:type III restriction enzyme